MARIIKTVGPRGYKPKYGVTEDGTVVELYAGPPIKLENYGSSEVYNWDFLNINKKDEPFFLSNLGKYTGTTDAERIAWLQDQMLKMEAVAKEYAKKIKDISADSPDLAKAVAGGLVLVGGKLLTTVPPVGALVAGVGLIIKFLNGSKDKEILEFKKEKVLEWSAIIQVLQKQYLAYNDEIIRLKNKKMYSLAAVAVLFLIIIYKKHNG